MFLQRAEVSRHMSRLQKGASVAQPQEAAQAGLCLAIIVVRDLRALFARQKEAEAEQSAAAEARRGCEQDSEKKDSAAQDSLAEEPGPVVDKRKRATEDAVSGKRRRATARSAA